MKTLSVLSCLVVSLLLLAGCSGSPATPSPASGSPTSPSTLTAAPSEPTVTIVEFRFEPAAVIIEKGSSLTWINKDSVNHQISFKSGPLNPMSPILKPGESWRATFLEVGDFPYNCTFYPALTGTVNVRLATDLPPPPPAP
ncbi:MAG: cupredoxin domain-containing protein [bacterium]